ncbi:MAG: cysteine desulfurase, partial [Opitutales bacterium]
MMHKSIPPSFRPDFPILDQEVHGYPLAYLDNAATTQKPRAVTEAVSHYYEKDNSNVHRGIHELSHRATLAYEAARERTAAFIRSSSEKEIVFTRGTTEAINLVARAWGDAFLNEGDKILLTEMEHHSNIVPWQLLAKRKGAELVYLPITGDEGRLDLSDLDSYLTADVKLFAFTHVSNALGTINPAEDLCRRAREKGILTLVDAAQSIGHLPLDVQKIGCDFLVFSGHKMCAPTGIGVLYGRESLLNSLPPFHGGGEMIITVGLHESTWKDSPHRFEAGTPPIAGAIGLHKAMDYLDEIGREAIFRYDHELGTYAYHQLSQLKNIRLLGPPEERTGTVSFHFPHLHAHDVTTFADRKGIALRGGHHCTQPLMKKLGLDSTSRASFYFYNTREEADRLVEAVAEVERFF